MKRYTFKSLAKELAIHFGEENVVFNDDGKVKTLTFGCLMDPRNESGKYADKLRMFEINNRWGFNFITYNKVGNNFEKNSKSFNSFSIIANKVILDNIKTYTEKSNNYVYKKSIMSRTSDNEEEELKNCIMLMKLQNKFEDFYEIIKRCYFDSSYTGLSGFYIKSNSNNEEDLVEPFKKSMERIVFSYETNKKKDFIENFEIDIVELSEAIRKLMYKSHTDKKFPDRIFFILKSTEELSEIFV